MNCYMDFCIYQTNGKCTLKEIVIDESGMCSDCICINIDKNILHEAKAELLVKFSE